MRPVPARERRCEGSSLSQSGNIVIKKRLAEAQSLQKQIREAELELARIKAKHPVDNVSSAQLQTTHYVGSSTTCANVS